MLRLIFGKISLHTALQSDPIYVFTEMKLRDLVPNFHIHVTVSNLYIPTISPPILLQQPMMGIYKSLTDT